MDTERTEKEIKRFLKRWDDEGIMEPELLAKCDWNDVWDLLILALIFGWDGHVEKEDDNGRNKDVC